MQQPASATWLALRRELFSLSLDPWTLREVRRGFLPVGALVEDPESVLRDADARKLCAVTIRVRSCPDSDQIQVERVATDALRAAVELGSAAPPPPHALLVRRVVHFGPDLAIEIRVDRATALAWIPQLANNKGLLKVEAVRHAMYVLHEVIHDRRVRRGRWLALFDREHVEFLQWA